MFSSWNVFTPKNTSLSFLSDLPYYFDLLHNTHYIMPKTTCSEALEKETPLTDQIVQEWHWIHSPRPSGCTVRRRLGVGLPNGTNPCPERAWMCWKLLLQPSSPHGTQGETSTNQGCQGTTAGWEICTRGSCRNLLCQIQNPITPAVSRLLLLSTASAGEIKKVRKNCWPAL